MSGFKGCINGVCSWEGIKYLSSVGVPGGLLESITLKKAAESAAAAEAMRASYTVYKAAPPPAAYVPPSTRTIVTTKNDNTLMSVLAGIAIGAAGLYLAIAMSRNTPPPAAPPSKPPSARMEHKPLQKDMKVRVQDLYKRMDVTKSGSITLQDLRTLGYRSKDASWILDHMDIDKDGIASLDEFLTYFAARQAEVGEKKMLDHLAVFESEVEAHVKRQRLDNSQKS